MGAIVVNRDFKRKIEQWYCTPLPFNGRKQQIKIATNQISSGFGHIDNSDKKIAQENRMIENDKKRHFKRGMGNKSTNVNNTETQKSKSK